MVFDLKEEEFFFELVRIFERFRGSVVKERVDLFALLLGLNHLREWIAPGYNPKNCLPRNLAEQFYNAIYSLPEWKTINDLCNKTKHLKKIKANECVDYGLPMSQWPSITGTVRMSKGPPSG